MNDLDTALANLGLDDSPIVGVNPTSDGKAATETETTAAAGVDTPDAASPKEGTPSEDQIAEWLAKADHKALSKLPAYNQQLQRAQAKLRKELEVESAAKAREASLIAEWDTWFQNLSDDEFRQAMADPQKQRAYEVVRDYKARQGANLVGAHEVAAKIVEGLQKQLQTRPEFEGLKWDELLALDDPGDFFSQIIDHGMTKEKARLAREVEARVAEELAKRNLSSPEPSSAPGDSMGRGSDSDSMLRDFAAGRSNDFSRVIAALGPEVYRRGR